MRTRIIFSLKNRGAYVPFHHQYLLAQVIKGLLDVWAGKAFLDFNQYNFSGLKGQTKVSRKGLHYFSSKVTLVFACPDKAFMDYFLARLFEQKEVIVGNLHLVPESVEEEERINIGEEGRFLCISPVVVIPAAFNDDSGKKFVSPQSDEFSDCSTIQPSRAWKRQANISPINCLHSISFRSCPTRTIYNVYRRRIKKFARIYPLYDNDVKFEVRGYTFPFTLYAAREVQQYVYENGLGHFTHKGFGMLDVANNDSIQRTEQQEMVYA